MNPTAAGAATPRAAARPAATAPRWAGAGATAQFAVLTARSLREVLADKRIAVFGLLQPLILLALLTQVFGTLVDTRNFPGGTDYVDFLVPALLVTTAIGTAPGAGLALVKDLENGMVSRFRSLPVRMGLVVVARSVAELARTALELAALLTCAWLLFGFSPSGGPVGAVTAYMVALAVAWALMWVNLALGAWLRDPRLLQSLGFLVVMPLTFASSAFAPTDGLPGWLRFVAVVNPVTHAVDAARALALGWPAGPQVVAALATGLALTALSAAAAVRTIRRPDRRDGKGR